MAVLQLDLVLSTGNELAIKFRTAKWNKQISFSLYFHNGRCTVVVVKLSFFLMFLSQLRNYVFSNRSSSVVFSKGCLVIEKLYEHKSVS